jgi:carbamoyl-phosphate synthase large subunit
VIQRALPGVEFSVDCLGDLDGRPLGAIPRSMIQSKGGEQIKGETLDDPQLVELAAGAVARLGLRGPSTVQCFREDGRILGITDINTRFGGAFPLPQAAGGEYAELVVRLAAGERVEPRLGHHRVGVVITRFLDQHLLVRGVNGLTPADGARGTVR